MTIELRGLAPLLYVFDMRTSLHFYRDQLGFELIGTDNNPRGDFDWVLLRLGTVEIMLQAQYGAQARPPQPDPARRKSHGDTEIYFACPDVDATHEYLARQGVEAEKPFIAHYGFKRFSLEDPDGYRLCFHWRAA